MAVEQEILHVTHEVSELEPADDIIVEYSTRIECYQAKHSTDPHSLIDLTDLTEPQTGSKPSLLNRFSGIWQELRSRGEKSVEIHIYTNRAAGPDLRKILDGDQISEKVLGRKKNVKSLHDRLVASVSLNSKDDVLDFLRSLRFNLRKPNADQLEDEIKNVWLNERLGLESTDAYDQLMRRAGRWFREPESRPIKREEVLKALQIDHASSSQDFPVDKSTFISRKKFERRVINTLNEAKNGYMALIGAPGSGKSTFITQQLIPRIRQKRVRIIRYYWFTSGSDVNYRLRLSRDEFLKSVIEQLLRECSDLLPGTDQRYNYSQERLVTLLSAVGEALKDLGKYLVFIVDGIDHLERNNPKDSSDILEIFPPQPPEGIICFFGCQGLQYLPSFIRRKCEGERTFDLPHFTLSQTRRYLSKYQNNQSSLRLANVIHGKCKGLPLYLRYMAEGLSMDSNRTPNQLVEQFPEYDGDIKSYYATLWDEFGDDSSIQKLCGLAAQLQFSVRKEDLIEMAAVGDNFEGMRPFRRIEHLLLGKAGEYSLFHESFRIFVSNELDPAAKKDLDRKILQYLKDQTYSEIWFQHAYRYAEKCEDDEYLTESFGRAYVEKAISQGRDPEEIINVLRSAVSAAGRKENFVKVAELSLLIAHTSNRLDYHLDRSELLRVMILLGNSEHVLSIVTNSGKDLKLTSQNAKLLILMADYGGLEQCQGIADDFIDRLDSSTIDPDLSDEAVELIAIYRPLAFDMLVDLIPTLLEDRRKLTLRTVLRRLYDKGSFETIRILKKWLQSLEKWAELRKDWYFWIAENEYRTRRGTCVHHIIKAGHVTRDPSQSILLSEMVWKLDGDQQLVASLMEGLNLNGKRIVLPGDLVGGLNFGAIRTYVQMLISLGREQEVDVLEEYASTKESTMQALYVRTNIKMISTSEADALRDALILLVSEGKNVTERNINVRMAIRHDLPNLLSYAFKKYAENGGNIWLLIDEIRDENIGDDVQINGHVLVEALTHTVGANSEWKSLLKDEYGEILDSTLETQMRTSELLKLAELAANRGYRNLANDCFEKAIVASRGYGYRKDTTLRLLINALDISIKRGLPDPLPQIAQIADWNLLVAKFTDGKSTRWFPHVLYDIVLSFNRNLALQLLVTYSENLPAWQFYYAVERFTATWEGEAVEIAYLCTELISEHSQEYPYASKFNARISLLENLAKIDSGNADWVAEQIQKFLVTEVPPDVRGPFIEQFNNIAEKYRLHQIKNASVYTKADEETPDFMWDSKFVIDDKEVTVGELSDYMSQSVEVFARCIRFLKAKNMIHKYRGEISYVIEKLVSQAREEDDVKGLYDIVQTNEDIESKSRLIVAQSLLDWGNPSDAMTLCKNVFHDDNKYDIWSPRMESIELLASLDPEYAIEMLLSFAEQYIQKHTWIGYGIFLVFIKALDRLGDEYIEIIHELYSSYSRFVEHQFESLETDVSSPYQWMREETQSRVNFVDIVPTLVAKEWETPALHRRESLMSLVYEVALRQSNLVIPWLIGLLKNDNLTVSEQAAVVLHSVALRHPELLSDYCGQLMSHMENPHFTRVNHIAGCLDNLEMAPHLKESMQQTLRGIRPTMVRDSVVISEGSLRPSLTFRERAWKRTVPVVVKEVVKNVARALNMELSEIKWRIESVMYQIGYDEESSNKNWVSYRRKFVHPGSQDWIPFESYDSHFVWHALNTIVEKRIRESSVSGPQLRSLMSIMGLYDPLLPTVSPSPKPADISIPYVSESQLRAAPNIVEAWLNSQGESAVTRTTALNNGWVTIFDEYDMSAGCASERCVIYPFFASKALSDAILYERYSPELYEYVEQIGHTPPCFTMTRLEAKELLNQSYYETGNLQTEPVPIVATHDGWLWSRSQPYTSIARRWIQIYDLKWDNAQSLDLYRDGCVVQRFVEWKDGAEAGTYAYRPVGRGTRLNVRSGFLETIMSTYNLDLILVSDRTRWLKSRIGLVSEPTKEERKRTVKVVEIK